MSKLEELLKENKRLQERNSLLLKKNKLFKMQLKWDESATGREKKLTIGQQQIFSSNVEAMRALFQNSEIEKGFISIKSVSDLSTKLGDELSKEEVAYSTEELEELCKVNPKGFQDKLTFEQFLAWYIKRSNNRERYNMVRLDVLKKSSVKLQNIKRKNIGKVGTLSFRVRYFYESEDFKTKQISPWNDVPLVSIGKDKVDGKVKLVNFICEVPKWSRAKFEIAINEKYNPIRQDVKFGKLRNYQHGDLMFNYGSLPQTFESTYTWKDTGKPGDRSLLNALDLGTRQMEVGEIAVVKVLGILALIDEDETDWKVITMNISDPLAQKINDIDDVETFMPGSVSAIREYFRIYKVCTGSEPNYYALGEMPKGKDYAFQVLMKTHQLWKELYTKKIVPPKKKKHLVEK